MWSSFRAAAAKSHRTLTEGLAFLPEDARNGILGEGARDLYPRCGQGADTWK